MKKGFIKVVDLEVDCIVGVFIQERRDPQKLQVTLEIALDFEKVRAEEHHVVSGLDYDAVCRYVSKKIVDEKYKLLEDLVCEVGEGVMEAYDDVLELMLKVKKAGALENAQYVQAEMLFTRK